MPKIIHSSLLTNSNGKALTKIYVVAPRRFKDKVKAEINIEKLLRIIMSIQVKGVTVGNLMANYFYVYRTFFERAISKNRRKKKDSIVVNTIRTSVNARAAFFRKNPVTFRTLFRVIITLNDSVELRGFINLNAEINYIDKVIYKQLSGVIMTLSLNMKMISHSNHRIFFMGVCENVRLAVRLIKYEVYLFIIDVKTSYFLMLDAFFIF
jgi:hypothetical protein